jgi:dTDP-4-amino-4,6-dideoxygalactose transaminase
MNVPPVKVPFSESGIDFIQERVRDVLTTGQVTMGKYVSQFEKEFAEFIGTGYAIGTNTGFSALEIILRSLNVAGSSVVVPTNTSMATPYSVLNAGGKVIFCDISKQDLGFDVLDLERKIRDDTKAVIPVHIGGIISSQMDAIRLICDRNGIALIEDDAHAHGASTNGKKAGSLGRAGAFSFYATKVMTCGEGGMITTDDPDLYSSALVIRNYGRPDPHQNIHTEFGANFRLSEFHAIVGLEQLRKIDWMLSERRRLAKIYDRKLEDLDELEVINPPNRTESAYYKYIAYLKNDLNREKLSKKLKGDFGITLPAEVYASPCHSQPFFRTHSDTMANSPNDSFPNAEYFCKNHICLPLYPGLREEEIDFVVDALKSALYEEKKK